MGRRIRVWTEGSMYHATFQCVDRMFLLKPCPKVNEIIGSSLGRALDKFPILLHGMTANINHIGMVFSIGVGQLDNVSSCLQLFSNLCARELNKHHQREGHFWSGRVRVEEIVDSESAESMLLYDALNPVKDGLVEKSSHWEGFSTNQSLSTGEPLKYKFIALTKWWQASAGLKSVPKKQFEETVEIKVHPLPAWSAMNPTQRQTRFRILLKEEHIRIYDSRGEKPFIGKEKIRKQDPFGKPKNPREKSPQKLCHAATKEAIEVYKKQWKRIRDKHIVASADFRRGNYDTEFPDGTFKPPIVSAIHEHKLVFH